MTITNPGASPLTGRTILVTGATSGIGRRLGKFLLDRGAYVVAVGRNQQVLEELSRSHGDNVLTLAVDVSDAAAVAEAVVAAGAWRGRLDGLVTAAGTTNFVPAEDETPADFARVLDVNVLGVYSFCHHAGRVMLAQGEGSIVNIASINAHIASGGEVGYCASKAAVVGMTRELAAQWSARGVRVNALSPGYFPSEMTAHLYSTPEGMARMSRSAMKRPGEPHELNGAVEFLLTDASSFMTGQSLIIDGGLTIL